MSFSLLLVNSHHAKIPCPEPVAPECGDKDSCGQVRSHREQVILFADFHTDAVDHGSEYAREYECKQDVLSPKQQSCVCHQLDVSASDCFTGGEIIQTIQKKADTYGSDQMGDNMPVIMMIPRSPMNRLNVTGI